MKDRKKRHRTVKHSVDEFNREVASLGSSDKFMSFLEERAKEKQDIPLKEVAKKRGIENP